MGKHKTRIHIFPNEIFWISSELARHHFPSPLLCKKNSSSPIPSGRNGLSDVLYFNIDILVPAVTVFISITSQNDGAPSYCQHVPL